MAKHGMQSATFIGHSLGTVYLAWLARLQPQLLASAVFIDPIVFLLHHHKVAQSFLYSRPEKTNFRGHVGACPSAALSAPSPFPSHAFLPHIHAWLLPRSSPPFPSPSSMHRALLHQVGALDRPLLPPPLLLVCKHPLGPRLARPVCRRHGGARWDCARAGGGEIPRSRGQPCGATRADSHRPVARLLSGGCGRAADGPHDDPGRTGLGSQWQEEAPIRRRITRRGEAAQAIMVALADQPRSQPASHGRPRCPTCPTRQPLQVCRRPAVCLRARVVARLPEGCRRARADWTSG